MLCSWSLVKRQVIEEKRCEHTSSKSMLYPRHVWAEFSQQRVVIQQNKLEWKTVPTMAMFDAAAEYEEAIRCQCHKSLGGNIANWKMFATRVSELCGRDRTIVPPFDEDCERHCTVKLTPIRWKTARRKHQLFHRSSGAAVRKKPPDSRELRVRDRLGSRHSARRRRLPR